MFSALQCRLFISLIAGIVTLQSAQALYTPFVAQRRGDEQAAHSTKLEFSNKLASDGKDPFVFGNINVVNGINQIYVGTIKVNGKPFEVQLDTGSADLWLDTAGLDTSGFTNTGAKGSITYGDGTVAEGPILIGEVSFGDFTVKKQAFISAPGTNATANGDKGLLGLGTAGLSNIYKVSTNGPSFPGRPLLDNIFSMYPNEPNYFTFLLSRSIMGLTDGGVFTIGEVDANYKNVVNSPKVPVLAETNFWNVLVDAVIINGQKLVGGGHITNSTTKTVTLLDTGASGALAPKEHVDAMYGSISGATVDDSGTYTVPCNAKVDITYVIGGKQYYVNPLDAITPILDDETNQIICVGTWSYNDPTDPSVDAILGDPFLRNVYALYDFGNLTPGGKGSSFVQLLSITDSKQASKDFDKLNNARLAVVKSIQANRTASGSYSSASDSPGHTKSL